MFSVNVFCAKRDFPPKNGPVPIQAVNSYHALYDLFPAGKPLASLAKIG